jgi:hypothetical protein
MPILSGKGSEKLWKEIGKVKKHKTRCAIYALACRCQELESSLAEAMRRIEVLEGRGGHNEASTGEQIDA